MPHERLKLSITQNYPPEGSNQCITAFKNALYTDLEEIRNPVKFQSMWKKFNWMIIKWFVRFSSIPNPIMYKCNEINFCNFAFTGFCMTSATPVMMHCEMHRSVSCSMQFSLGHRGRDANIWEAFQLLRIQNGFSCNQQHSIFFSIFLSTKENLFFINANICWGHNVFRLRIYLFTLLWKSCVTDFYQHCQTYLFVLNRELNVYH